VYDTKKVILFVLAIVLALGGVYMLLSSDSPKPVNEPGPVISEEPNPPAGEKGNAGGENSGTVEITDPPAYDVEAEFAELDRLLDEGNLEEAEKKAEQILMYNQSDSAVRIRVADFFFEKLDNVQRAMEIIDEGLDLNRYDTDLMVAMAHFFTFQSDETLYPIALEMVQTAIQLKEQRGEEIPLRYMDILAWATALQDNGLEDALLLYNEIIQNPKYTEYDDPITMLHIGLTCEAFGDLDCAEQFYRAILELTDETVNEEGRRHRPWAKLQAGIALNRVMELREF